MDRRTIRKENNKVSQFRWTIGTGILVVSQVTGHVIGQVMGQVIGQVTGQVTDWVEDHVIWKRGRWAENEK